MSDRPVIRIGPQTANCAEVYINKVRIVACCCEDNDELMIEANGQVIEVKP